MGTFAILGETLSLATEESWMEFGEGSWHSKQSSLGRDAERKFLRKKKKLKAFQVGQFRGR